MPRQFQGSLAPIQDLQPERHPRPPTLQKFGSAADSGNHCKRCADDGVLAIRGALIGTAIGLVLWAAMFGLWYWL